MKVARTLLAALAISTAIPAYAADKAKDTTDTKVETTAVAPDYFKPEKATSEGSVTINGKKIDYQAVAGTLVVHPRGFDDAAPKAPDADKNPPAEASMFYTAYFKKGEKPGSRPITFLYNGGPGSSTVWLHMGAFGPVRVVTANDSHTDAAPYKVVNNVNSLLDATDLVFIDAPGTGFSRIAGKDKEKAFWGVDEDGHAFAAFINQFLSQYGRWNSPKYLFGESYGTTRSAVVSYMLQNDYSIDLNGVIMLSQILNFDFDADIPQLNPGNDTAYVIALPTFAATAWYHHKVPNQPADLEPFLKEVENFSINEYTVALAKGAALPDAEKQAIAEKLHAYTGLPVAYILKANLRINAGEFDKTLQDDRGLTTGRLDTRFSGPTIDPLSKESEYDPQSSAISSAYVSAFNAYVRNDLHFGKGKVYKPEINPGFQWDMKHEQPGVGVALPAAPNVMPDLATAMKQNPKLKVMLNGGYFDLATPYFAGRYEMNHLGLPADLMKNITYKYYQSGHMVYANEEAHKELHDAVAAFIRKTDNVN